MNNILELIIDIIPYVLSIFASIVAFKKGKVTKTAEEIELKAEAKKQKYLAKQLKKNKVTLDTKSESSETTDTVSETITTLN